MEKRKKERKEKERKGRKKKNERKRFLSSSSRQCSKDIQ